MKIVIVYDISDDKNRTGLAQALFRYGIRTQLSVFEADISKNELNNIYKIAERYSNGEDKVSVYEVLSIRRFGDVEFINTNDLIY